MFYTDDPIADYHRYDAERQKELDKLPKCSECGDAITDEKAYYINGEWICKECMSAYLREVEIDGGY